VGEEISNATTIHDDEVKTAVRNQGKTVKADFLD